MKMDIVIGNPPYQEMTGGGSYTESSRPIYNEFIEMAIPFTEYIALIIPSRWLGGGNSVLDSLRMRLITNNYIKTMVHYEDSKEIFPSVNIAGGIQELLIKTNGQASTVDITSHAILRSAPKETRQTIVKQMNRRLGKYTYTDGTGSKQLMIIPNNNFVSVVDKVMEYSIKHNTGYISDGTLPTTSFSLDGNIEGINERDERNSIKVIKINNNFTYISMDEIPTCREYIDKYKVCIGRLNHDRGGINNRAKLMVTTKPYMAGKNEVCTISHLVAHTFNTENEALNCIQYMKTILVRYLIYSTVSSIHIAKRNLIFVPLEDFTSEVNENELYRKYDLTEEEIKLMQDTIRIME